MAGFFGFFDFTKPGKGIEKGAPRKKGVALFFELFFRKFWSYVKLNMLYIITAIPAIIVYFLIFNIVFNINDKVMIEQFKGWILILPFIYIMLSIMLFGGGAVSSGYSYIIRNFYREEHSWILSDFFEQTKKNFKQTALFWIIDSVVLMVIQFSIKFYFIQSNNYVYGILMWILIVLFFLYIIMHFYIYTLIVTFHLTLKQIIKNSMLLSVLGMPRNMLGLIIIALYLFGLGVLLLSIPPIAIILLLTVAITPVGLIVQMIAYPVIKKYMIDPQNAEATETEANEEATEQIEAPIEEIIEYKQPEEETEPKPQQPKMIYEDGRLKPVEEAEKDN